MLFGKKKKEPMMLPPMVHEANLEAMRMVISNPQMHLTPEQAVDRLFAPGTLSDAEREQFIRELSE